MTKVCVEFDAQTPEPEEPRSYSTTLGNGTSTSFTVNHDLGGRDVFSVVRDTATGVLDGADVVLTSLSESSVRLDFATAPAVGGVHLTLLKA